MTTPPIEIRKRDDWQAQGWRVTAAESKDDRRNGAYWRAVLVTAPHPELPFRFHRHGAERYTISETAAQLALRAALGPGVVRVRVTRPYAPRTAEEDQLRAVEVRVLLKAERPSDVASEAAAVELGWSFVPAIADAIATSAAAVREQARRDAATRYADRLLGAAAESARKTAAALVRYDQRLAAIDAEYAAEVRVQAQALVDSGAVERAAERDKSDPGVQPEALAAVRRLLVETACTDVGTYRSARVLTERDVFSEFPDLTLPTGAVLASDPPPDNDAAHAAADAHDAKQQAAWLAANPDADPDDEPDYEREAQERRP